MLAGRPGPGYTWRTAPPRSAMPRPAPRCSSPPSPHHRLLHLAPGAGPRPAATAAPAPGSGSGLDLAGLDRSVLPGDDFYAYANGAWLKDRRHPARALLHRPLPRGRRRRDRPHPGHRRGRRPRRGAAAGTEEQQVGDYFASFMDEAGIEARGLAPLRPALARIAALADKTGAGRRAGRLDPRRRRRAQLHQLLHRPRARPLGGAGPQRPVPERRLPAPGWPGPARTAATTPRRRRASSSCAPPYRAHLAAMLTLAGVADADARAGRVLELRDPAGRAPTPAAPTRSDVAKANNPWTRADFDARAPGLDWSAFLGAAGLDRQPGLHRLAPRRRSPAWRRW